MVHTEQWRVTMLGDLAGKTSLAIRYTMDCFLDTYDPTIEDAYRRSVIIDDKMTYVEIIDTAGPEEYATLCEQWIREGEGYILVYSIASRFSYERMRSFQAAIVRVKGETRPTYMLVGNQSDREGERQVSRVEAQALSEEWDCPWMEVSAKTGRDVDRMFSDTIRALRANRDRDTRAKPSQPSVSSKSVKKPAIKTILFSNFFGTSREKDKEKGQEHEPDRELNRPVDDGDRMLWDISRLIGYFTNADQEDWAVVVEVCDRVNGSEANAKEASKALCKDIQLGRPATQLAAARLWAIMLHNCHTYFIAQTTSRKFLGKAEETALNPLTPPEVRNRLVKVIGVSVFQLQDTKYSKYYTATWKKLRSQLDLSAPIEGIKTNPDDPILNPTPHRPPSSIRQHPMDEQSSTKEEIVVPSNLSAPEMFQCLLEHGCVDVSLLINPDRHSTNAVAGGSFGDIWASELDDGTKVAIKCLRFHAIAEDQPKGLKRATREIYMWSKAKHPNVHELMGVIMFQGRLGMVSMWMENGSLHEYIRKNPSVDRYQLCIQAATGVSYLHSIRMVHGDIKALNILVSHDGVAKLSDFDHSILSNGTLAFSATTNVGGGTLRWMAPELLASTEDGNIQPATRTTQTDIYALGMTILEIVTGKVPYSEYLQDLGIIRALDKNKPPVRPAEFASANEQANAIWTLLLQCWDHDSAMRPGASFVLSSLQNTVGRSTLSS